MIRAPLALAILLAGCRTLMCPNARNPPPRLACDDLYERAGAGHQLAPDEHALYSRCYDADFACHDGSYGPSSGGPVHVRGYYRRDGTHVRPHTRSRPR